MVHLLASFTSCHAIVLIILDPSSTTGPIQTKTTKNCPKAASLQRVNNYKNKQTNKKPKHETTERLKTILDNLTSGLVPGQLDRDYNDWILWPNVIRPNGETKGCDVKKSVKRSFFYYLSLRKKVCTAAGDVSHYFQVDRRYPSLVAAHVYLSWRFFFFSFIFSYLSLIQINQSGRLCYFLVLCGFDSSVLFSSLLFCGQDDISFRIIKVLSYLYTMNEQLFWSDTNVPAMCLTLSNKPVVLQTASMNKSCKQITPNARTSVFQLMAVTLFVSLIPAVLNYHSQHSHAGILPGMLLRSWDFPDYRSLDPLTHDPTQKMFLNI